MCQIIKYLIYYFFDNYEQPFYEFITDKIIWPHPHRALKTPFYVILPLISYMYPFKDTDKIFLSSRLYIRSLITKCFADYLDDYFSSTAGFIGRTWNLWGCGFVSNANPQNSGLVHLLGRIWTSYTVSSITYLRIVK